MFWRITLRIIPGRRRVALNHCWRIPASVPKLVKIGPLACHTIPKISSTSPARLPPPSLPQPPPDLGRPNLATISFTCPASLCRPSPTSLPSLRTRQTQPRLPFNYPAHRASSSDPRARKIIRTYIYNKQDVCYTSTATSRCPRRARALYQVHWKAIHSWYVIFSSVPLLFFSHSSTHFISAYKVHTDRLLASATLANQLLCWQPLSITPLSLTPRLQPTLSQQTSQIALPTCPSASTASDPSNMVP